MDIEDVFLNGDTTLNCPFPNSRDKALMTRESLATCG
jgi:hypothetical protein